MAKMWTVEAENADGTWEKLGKLGCRAFRYKSEANAARDIESKHMRRYLQGARARPVRIDE